VEEYLSGRSMGPSLLMNCQWSRPAARKGDALRLVAVEKAWISAPLEHRCELPGEVDGVSDAGVHALPADGAVDMGGVAEEEGAAFAEIGRINPKRVSANSELPYQTYRECNH
jgi:hypothetical protein